MINEPLRLTVEQVTALSPSMFSVCYESAIYKNYWRVDLSIESGQVFLCNSHLSQLRFQSEVEAIKFCNEHWPEATQIKKKL